MRYSASIFVQYCIYIKCMHLSLKALLATLTLRHRQMHIAVVDDSTLRCAPQMRRPPKHDVAASAQMAAHEMQTRRTAKARLACCLQGSARRAELRPHLDMGQQWRLAAFGAGAV